MNNQSEESKDFTPIDEVELALEMMKLERPDLVEDRTYFQISQALNEMYGIKSQEGDIFLLHEPTVEELQEDLEVLFNSIGLNY